MKFSDIITDALMRSKETGLPDDYDLFDSGKSGPRLYQRRVNKCGECPCLCTGTMFTPRNCSQLQRAVDEDGIPPADCPLPPA